MWLLMFWGNLLPTYSWLQLISDGMGYVNENLVNVFDYVQFIYPTYHTLHYKHKQKSYI
jgi:hypothetical protein